MTITAGDPGQMPRRVQLVPVLQKIRRATEKQSEDLVRESTLIQQEIGKQTREAATMALKVAVNVVNLHAGEFRTVPIARLLRMGIKEHASMVNHLPGQNCRIGGVAQNGARVCAERHEAILHLKTRDEKFAIVQAAP